MKPGEVAGAVARLAEEHERAKVILLAMVRAKRRGEPDPEAWAAAFELADEWQKAGEGLPRPSRVRCPECSCILPNVSGKDHEIEPSRIACGPEHVLTYEDFDAIISPEGTATIHPHTRGGGSIVVGQPVFTSDDEGEDDADVPD